MAMLVLKKGVANWPGKHQKSSNWSGRNEIKHVCVARPQVARTSAKAEPPSAIAGGFLLGSVALPKTERPQPSEVERSSVGPGRPGRRPGEGSASHNHYAETAASFLSSMEIGDGRPSPVARRKIRSPWRRESSARRPKIYAKESGSFPT